MQKVEPRLSYCVKDKFGTAENSGHLPAIMEPNTIVILIKYLPLK